MRIVFVSLVCVCLLTSPTLATVALAKAVATAAVGKVAAVAGAGVALKTAAIKALGAKALAGLAIKTSLIKGGLALKGAVAGAALQAAAQKGKLLINGIAATKSAVLGVAAAKVGAVVAAKSAVVAKIPTLLDIISGVLCKVQESQTAVVGGAVEKVVQSQERIIVQSPLLPVLYEYITQPRVYYETVPVIQQVDVY
ncbi:uncharacterized protein LOC112058036 [Bicyclus anynana]|uniref:Uncharacterized protein LOC112058036 n=1 Tax=Bicyclus anynana TaxID=110368 RepID=A0A6J1P9J3_BICAN|nr:uncharacterized protein LOC112058036 [Bicyclus anynana]